MSLQRWHRVAAIFLGFTVFGGCDATEIDPVADGGSDIVQDAAADGGFDAAPETDTVGPPPVAAGEVVTVAPGGDTICSRGTEYRFFAAGGDTKRLVIDFQGGGACWSAFTCGLTDAIFAAEAPSQESTEAYWNSDAREGIYRMEDPRNPVAGWTLLHIPYCTGDIHWGDAIEDYGDDVVIHHRGATNTQAALAWMVARYPDATQILITGCSAGAYGAIGHAHTIAGLWPDADITVLGDAGAGIVSASFFKDSFPLWNVAALPFELPGLSEKGETDLRLSDLYLAVAAAHPNMRLAQYNAAFDDNQSFFLNAMGDDSSEWAGRLVTMLKEILDGTNQFTSYRGEGAVHCLHPYNFFYQRNTNGVSYASWLGALLNDASIPAPVDCKGTCEQDPICDSCLVDKEQAGCGFCTAWNK